MSNNNIWYKNNLLDKIWWKNTPDRIGEFIFSFDKQTEYNMFAEYPFKLSKKQKKIFDAENPFWADFFSDRNDASNK